jgi:lipopolysaccharide export system permease protein
MNKSTDNLYDPKMLSVRQLGKAIDSLDNKDSIYYSRTIGELGPYLKFLTYKDSTAAFKSIGQVSPIKKFNEIVPDSLRSSVQETINYSFSSLLNNLGSIRDIYNENVTNSIIHSIEWHRKFTLSFACIILFLIGAPLGSIIRKGGLGTPLVSAIVFFVLFYLLNNFGEKFAKSGEWSVYTGMWFSSILLLPVGLFLTYKAMRDSQLFNQEFYYRLLQPIKVTLRKYFKK